MNTEKLVHVVGEVAHDRPAIIRFFGPVNDSTVQSFNEEFL